MLFGTGIRGRSSDAAVRATIGGVAAEVTGALPQGQYPGLDQVNVRLPRSLAGKGEVNIALTVDGKAANTVTVRVGGTPPPRIPTITALNPTFGSQGQTIAAFTVTGQDIDVVTGLEFDPPAGISVSNLKATATTLTAQVAIATDAALGTRSVALVSPNGKSNPLLFEIRTAPPVLPGASYLPLAAGMSWEYRVQFAEQASLPYRPIFEAPPGLLCASGFCGTGPWPAGQIDFKVTVGEKLSTDTGDSYRVTLTDPGRKFFFYLTDPQLATEMRVREVSGSPQLEILGSLQADYFRFYRPLARVAASDLTATQTLAVPAGEFKDVIKTSLTLTGDGSYVRGTYTTEVYLAPNVGLIKAVQKDSSGKVLYTQELTKASSGGTAPPSGVPRITKVEPGSFKIGETVTLTITGENMSGVTGIEFGYPALRYTVTDLKVTATTVTARVTATAPSGTVLNPFVFVTVWVVSPAGPSDSETLVLVKP
jgi:hypothetical protein